MMILRHLVVNRRHWLLQVRGIGLMRVLLLVLKVRKRLLVVGRLLVVRRLLLVVMLKVWERKRLVVVLRMMEHVRWRLHGNRRRNDGRRMEGYVWHRRLRLRHWRLFKGLGRRWASGLRRRHYWRLYARLRKALGLGCGWLGRRRSGWLWRLLRGWRRAGRLGRRGPRGLGRRRAGRLWRGHVGSRERRLWEISPGRLNRGRARSDRVIDVFCAGCVSSFRFPFLGLLFLCWRVRLLIGSCVCARTRAWVECKSSAWRCCVCV
jgi:hypothetical protein